MMTPHLSLRLLALIAVLGLAFPAASATLTRTSAFTYDAGSGLLTKEIIEPDDSNLCLVTEYVYDSYGNKTSATTRNCNGTAPEVAAPTGDAVIASRTSSSTFDARGQFPTTSSNALNQSETRTFDPRFGTVLTLTGPNGLSTTWAYDNFGRKTLETRADGTKTRWEYLYCAGINGGSANCPTVDGASGPSGAWVLVTTPLASDGVTQNGPVSKTYYDGLNREIRKETQGFDGTGTSTALYQDTQYDSLGRPYKKSRPYYSGQSAYWTTLTYDSLNRPIQETHADGATTTTAYNGLTVTVTNAKSQTRTTVKNSQGQVVSVTDANSQTLTYAYDPFGNLARTTDALGNKTTLTYDLRGRKTGMQDPDMGTWSYAYNALGQLIRQTDAKAQVSTLTYDLLGRLTQRAEADLISAWYYDSYKNSVACPKGIGKLCQAETSTGYTRTHAYDSLGRPISTSTTLDVTYTSGVSYDTQGRIATQSYPSGLTVKYGYTALGYLKDLRKNDTNALYWQADSQDAEGHLLTQSFGNGVQTTQSYTASNGRLSGILAGAGNAVQNLSYQYDSLGNITNRADANQNLTETFVYDTLNRVTSSTVNSSGAGIITKTYAYDVLGNITSRSDLGSYSYPASGATSVRPHALSQVTLTAGGRRTYSYDANGSLTTETEYDAADQVIAGKGRIEVYTSFNMPQAMGSPSVSSSFYYGPEHQRIKQISSSLGTTFYLNPGSNGDLLFEKDLKPDSSVEERHFLTAGGQVVALVKRINGTTWSTRYLHRDNLGSTTAVTDEAGTVIERLAYEPFGKRRFAIGTDDPNNTIVPLNTERGYTNHEHIDELGLIHMNGRVYDPTIGRFMSADPVIQDPNNLQSYNRYAYVMNNPLFYTDPSGYSWLSKTWKKIWHSTVGRAVVTVAVAYFTGQYIGEYFANSALASTSPSWAVVNATSVTANGVTTLVDYTLTTAGSAAVGAGAGFASGIVGSGGDLREGFNGAIGGGFSGAINGYYGSQYPVTRVIANSAAGGMGAVLRGDKFADGFKSSFAISSLTYLNFQMRQAMIADSQHPMNDGTGLSKGMFGDLFKLAGGRWDPNAREDNIVQCSTLGCQQNGPGSVFGIGYSKGGFVDMVMESFAGPHDKANSYWFYDQKGLIVDMAGPKAFALNMATNYTTSLIFAAPFAVGAILDQTNLTTYRVQNRH